MTKFSFLGELLVFKQ